MNLREWTIKKLHNADAIVARAVSDIGYTVTDVEFVRAKQSQTDMMGVLMLIAEQESVEDLARQLHSVYQKEAERQGDVRYGDYDSLPDHVKRYDIVLAEFILENFTRK